MDEEEAKRLAAASSSGPSDSGGSSSAPLEAPADSGSSAPADSGSSAPADSGSSPSQQSGSSLDSDPHQDQYTPPAVSHTNDDQPKAPPKDEGSDINQNPAEALSGDAGYQAPNVGAGQSEAQDQGSKDSTGTQAYLQGTDAMPPQYSNLIDQKVDPDGTMSPSERVIKGINYAAQNYGMDAASDKLAHHQQMFQHYTHGLAQAAAQNQDWAKAAHYATQGYKHVPDGLDVAFEPTSTGAIAKIAPDDPHLQPTSLMLNGAEFSHYLKHGTFDHIMMQGIGQTLDSAREAGQQYAANDTGVQSDTSGGSAEPVDTRLPQRGTQDTSQPVVPPKPEDTQKAVDASGSAGAPEYTGPPELPAVGDTAQPNDQVSDKAAPPREARPWDPQTAGANRPATDQEIAGAKGVGAVDFHGAKVRPDGTFEFDPKVAEQMKKEGYTDRALNTWETPEAVKSREDREGLPMVDTLRGGPHPSSTRSFKQSDGTWAPTQDPKATYAPPPQRGAVSISGGQAEYEPPPGAHQKKVNGEWVDTPEQKSDHQAPQGGGGRDTAQVKPPSISDDDIKNVNKFNDKTNQKNKLSPAENDREIALEKKYGWELGDWEHPGGTSRQNPGGDMNAPAPGPDPKMNKKLASEGDKPLSQPMPGKEPAPGRQSFKERITGKENAQPGEPGSNTQNDWVSPLLQKGKEAVEKFRATTQTPPKPVDRAEQPEKPTNGKTGQPIPEGDPVKPGAAQPMSSATRSSVHDWATKYWQDRDVASDKDYAGFAQGLQKRFGITPEQYYGMPKEGNQYHSDPDRLAFDKDKDQYSRAMGERAFQYQQKHDAEASQNARYSADSHVKAAGVSASGHVQGSQIAAGAHVRGSQISADAHRDAAAMHADASVKAAKMAAKARRAAAIWEFYAKQNQAKAAIRAAKAHANATAQASMNHAGRRRGE